MKYIKFIHEKELNIQESIGTGSVVLIKGSPNVDGRYLYVTTINGYTEIKPGVKMVHLNLPIYRVIVKDSGQFYGRKVDYKKEDGLIGTLNTRNPYSISIVLNNNKTPFHWETLKHTDIGSALRSLGTRLFMHDLIF